MTRHRELQEIADALITHVPDVTRTDLSREDPIVAFEVHFPDVRLRALPSSDFRNSECSTDGYYETNLVERPWILYAADVSASRARFTLLHELAHHLLQTACAHLLDGIDQLGRSAAEAAKIEEAVCHRFAGGILLPTDLVTEVLGEDQLRPHHIVDLHEQSEASWEAVAIRAVDSHAGKAAVVLVREHGRIAFCAASPKLRWNWWPRGSTVPVGGPLSKAFSQRQRALPETYRAELPAAERMYCDTIPVHAQLAIAVLSDKPSDGHFDILEAPAPAWQEREEFCEWDGAERNVGWCDLCKGRLCSDCGRCGCSKPLVNPRCPVCGNSEPVRPGARVCRTCEADGLG